MVSVNTSMKVLQLTNTKCLADESVLEKIERFSVQGVERNFFFDGQKLAKLIPRLNRRNNDNNWLSMQPNTLKYCDEDGEQFGEVNANNRMHGRGIKIWKDGGISIGYYENGLLSTGNYINILHYGKFRVGEYYTKDGIEMVRGTRYMTDGKEEKYDI